MKTGQNTKGNIYHAVLAALLLGMTTLGGCEPGTINDKKENDSMIRATINITEIDKTVAVEIPAVRNGERGNASGPKITSGAHSDAFPGIVFVWDSKAAGGGYLIVSAGVFNEYESFTLTAKEGPDYWDFVIRPEAGQQKNEDGNYVFYIPRASGGNKINMVFLSERVGKDTIPDDPVVPDDPVEIIEEEAELVKVRPGGMSSAHSGEIAMGPLGEDVVFMCAVDDGVLYPVFLPQNERFYTKNIDVHSGDGIYWISQERLDKSWAWVLHTFIEIVLKSGQNITGYVVIEADAHRYGDPLFILKSVIFPKVDGEYQNVSGEYVKAAIEQVKAEAVGGDL